MKLDLTKWGPMTALMVAVSLIVVLVGGVIVIVNPDTLSFADYLNLLWKLALAVAGLGLGRAVATLAPTVLAHPPAMFAPSRLGSVGSFDPIEPAEAEGPGDPDQFPDLPVTDPKELPPDEGEGNVVGDLVDMIAATAPQSGYLPGLSEKHRRRVRTAIHHALSLSVKHSSKIDYTQGPRRWEWKAKSLFASLGRYPHDTDCSGWATWVLYQGLRLFHVHDVVNGWAWRGGFTGTMLHHGIIVHHESNIRIGDLAIYGTPGTSGAHVAVCIGGGYVLSHGSPGIHKLPLHYRSDLIVVRRYF